ncbi:MAG: hypothetical protein IJT59_07975, partial [Desulfovibrionaceae bacterium]|nr:hypothetical protein [Desulfovibrionaceae bacterium]
MSQLNVNQGIPRYSIEQFQQIAKNSRDNQELRIRVSNQQLTNTSLGCLASIFKHKESNTQVNRAFMQSILTDNRYQCVAKQIHTALSTTMPEQEALTPAKIKTALSTANSILRAHKDGVEIANRMCNIDVLPQNMVNEFASFYTNYVADNPDIKIDTQDFGSKNLLTAAERKLPDRARESARQDAEGKRIRPLGEMIKEFYLEGDRVERSGFFKYQPSDCANDPAKADALNKLFAENSADIPNLKTPKSINDALQGCFDTGNLGRIPSSGSIFSLWKGDLH